MTTALSQKLKSNNHSIEEVETRSIIIEDEGILGRQLHQHQPTTSKSSCTNLEVTMGRIKMALMCRLLSSGFVGVSWHKSTRKWQAKIQFDGKRRHLGYFLQKKRLLGVMTSLRSSRVGLKFSSREECCYS